MAALISGDGSLRPFKPEPSYCAACHMYVAPREMKMVDGMPHHEACVEEKERRERKLAGAGRRGKT